MELGLEQWLIIVSVWFQFLAAKSKDFWKPQKKIHTREATKNLSQLGNISFSQTHRVE